MADIRETGYQSGRQLLLENNAKFSEPSFDELMSGIQGMRRASTGLLHLMFAPTYSEPIGLKLALAGYGNSVYDENAVSDWDLADLNEVRAVNQSGLLQLGNGALKLVGTGITTFLDGTVGTLYGLGTGIVNALDEDENTSFLQGLWDNDFNKAMSDIQDSMEEALPNYYSEAEKNAPWYTNILSANFIGDKVLKNMGFTIGALGALYATGGLGIAGGIGKGVLAATKFVAGTTGKVLKASRGTLAGINSFSRGSGQLAHHLVLSAIGASGEASIEAINAVKEGAKDAYRNLEIRRLALIDSLDPNSPDYYLNLNAIDSATELYRQEIDSKFRDAGNSVYLANMAILSVSNAIEFAPLIKGGFQRSAKLADFERRLGDRVVGALEWAQGILRGEQASITNTVDKGWGRALSKTLLNSLSEGTEEASQNLASNSNQLWAKARLNLDAADTILGPRINPEATEEITDYTKAFSKALYDNFGSPESLGWEEFFLGALTGGIGFIGLSPHGVKNEQGEQMYDPITHKKVTSWKPRSISDWFQGGIVAARREINEEYEENQKIVDAVNQRLSDPEFIKRTQHAIASKALANEMDAALLENDMFKFKNSEIGKLVEDVFFFRDKGMIDEYKAIYQGMTSIDDKTLQQLYAATSDAEGNTELALEDMEAVRQDYQGKAKRNLEKIQMIQDYYDFVDLEYRDRSQLFKEELAYQYIRLDDTRRRILELEEKNEEPSRVKAAMLGFADTVLSNDKKETTYRENYLNSFQGLTESEQKDLERLKRLEKVYLNRIDKIKKNPAWIDLQHNLAYSRAKRDYDSKDVESLINRLKQANSVSEIDYIIASADQSVKQEIINRAYSEGDEALRNKLKSQISASTAYTESKKRLDKIWEKEEAKEMNDAMTNLLYLVYMSNNMDLNEVKKVLQQIYDELQEDSINTVSQLMPDSYEVFERFLGEENKQEKGIFSDVLEGAIEDVGNGIRDGELWKTQRETANRVKKQQAEAEANAQLQEEKKKKKAQSSELAIQNSTYVKNFPNLEAYKEEIENFGIEELDDIIKKSLLGTEYENDDETINKVIRFAISMAIRGKDKFIELRKRWGGKNSALDNLFSIFEKRFKGTSSSPAKKESSSGISFKDLLKQAKEADKKGDAATVLSIVKQVAENAVDYMQQGAKSADMDYLTELEKKYKNKKSDTPATEDTAEEHENGEVTSETTEKDGVKTTKFTWWIRSKKTDKVVPAIGGGLAINAEDIDEDSLNVEDVEKVILTELREKDGKFTGTIRYSIKGQKGRIDADVKFKRNPTLNAQKSESKEGKDLDLGIDVDINKEQPEVVLASDVNTLVLLNKFYSSVNIDPNTLSIEEQEKILDNLEKTISLIKDNKEVPTDLLAYAAIVLDNNTEGTVISETEQKVAFPEANAINAEELNGAFRGLYEVGNSSTGTPNLLLQMLAERASTSSLEANYGSVQHAELVQWCIDNILKDLKAAEVPVKVVAIVGQTYADGRPNVTLYTAVKADAKVGPKKNKTVKDIAKNRWLQETNDGEYIIIGTLGYNGSSLEQASNWASIREDIDNLIANAGVTEGYFVSANEKHTLKINNIGEGRPARTHYQHTSSNSIVELIEGSDKGRNPQGLTLGDLKWLIVYTDEAKPVNVKKDDRIRGNANLELGKVYVLIPTPSGSYYRHPVSPVTINEANKDSKLYKKVDSLIEKIIKNKKVEDIIALKGLLVLEKESEELSFLDIYFNDAGIRVQYTPNKALGSLTSVILSKDEDEAIDQLKDIIYNQIRPFISVTLGHLSSPNSIRMLDEAGALQLKGDLAMFSYVGANYTVIPYNSTTNSNPESKTRSSLQSDELEFWYNGQQIFRDGNDYKRSNGELITDSREIEILNDIRAINDGQYVGEKLWKWKLLGKRKNWIKKPMVGEYYFIQKGTFVTVYHKDDRGNITKEPQDEVNKLLNTRAKVQKFNTTLAREAAIQSGEAEAGEDITVIDDEEGEKDLTKEETESKDDKKQEALNGNTEEIEASIEARKQDAIKRATYDLELAGIKIGDFISQGSNQDLTELGKIVDIIFYNSLNPDIDNDTYSYSDINGTVYAVILTSEPNIKAQIRVDRILKSKGYYKKIDKQSQKSLKNLDNSKNYSTFAARLLDSKLNTSAIEDVLYDKAASIAEAKRLEFDEDCSIEELIKWFKENVKFDLNSIPSNADMETILEIIENCK